jgi:UDP-N-acetylmuramoylalanine--D-glutamate ligase
MHGLERYRNCEVGVMGLARSGLAAVRELRAAGAVPLAWDDRPEAVEAAVALGARPGATADIPRLAALVTSPGVPLDHPVVAATRAAGVPLTCDIELFCEALPEEQLIIAVTGTNGKSTTAALIHHLLVAAGQDAVLGGNIGVPALDLEPGPPSRRIVLEVSSFQLDLCTGLRPRIAVWTNLSPDHLDRHGSLAGYLATKRRIFARQGAGDTALVGVDDPTSAELADELATRGLRVVPVAVSRPLAGGISVVDGELCEDGQPVGRIDALARLRGRHNWQNAALAYGVGRTLDIRPETLLAGLAGFPGLPHRMEEVARTGSVLWINDSKATNPDSATKSLDTFDDIFWIAGGKPKPGGFRDLRPHLGRVRMAFLIGAAADEIAADLGDLVEVRKVGTLEAAVAAAGAAAARSGARPAVVLLAPACASFDQFRSFEHRGDVFRALVRRQAAAGVAA